MKLLSYCLLALCCGTLPAAGQQRRLGLGTRASLDGGGITAKYFLPQRFAVEAQVNAGGLRFLDGHSVYVVAMIQYHLPLPVPAFRIFFGGGVHAGIWTGRENTAIPNEAIAGLSGVGGIEYLFPGNRLGISADFRPSLNYVQEVEFLSHNNAGFAIRYYLLNTDRKKIDTTY